MARINLFKSLALAATCSVVGLANAQYYSSDGLFCSPDYAATSEAQWTRGGGASTGKVSMSDFHFTVGRSSLDKSSPQLYKFSFDCAMSWSFGASQGAPPSSGSGFGKGSCEMSTVYSGVGSDGSDLYSTELVSMDCAVPDGSGGGGGGGVLLLRESPTLASTGQTTIKPTTKPKGILNPYTTNGGYEMSSFFDVFTEVSLDGGQNWAASDGAVRLQGTPEPASMAAMGFGLVALLRRRRAKKA